MKTLFALAALASFQLATAQKTVEIKSFKDLAVSGGVHITLVESKENKLVIQKGDPNNLKVSSEERALAIKAEGNEDFDVTVYFKEPIEAIAVAGGVELTLKENFKTKNLDVNAAGGSEVHIAIDTDNLNAALASGSEMHFTGKAKNFSVAVASGAELDAENMKTENTSVVVASGAEGKIYVSSNVDATVASGGELTIHGNPKHVNQVKADGAEIHIAK